MAWLVTGGAGFIGSHFVRRAREEGRDVVVLDDLSTGRALPPSGVEFVKGDIGDAALVGRLVRAHRIDAVVHFAGKIAVGESSLEPAGYFDVNVSRSLALLETLRAHGVERFVFSSSASVYGAPTSTPTPELATRAPMSPYGATKLAFEHALEAYGGAYGLRWAALRYFNAAGAHPSGELREAHDPETHLIPRAIDAALGRAPPLSLFGDDYPTTDGTCIRDYVHVCDLAEAHVLALDAMARGTTVGPLNLGAGRGQSVRQILDALSKSMRRPVPFSVAAERPGDPPTLVADISLANELLGWKPKRSGLEDILDDAIRARP